MRVLNYRPELDGLRALAVLAVLGFHIAFAVPGLRHVFPGGFLGVDVFFVLSGMLITELLVSEHIRLGAVSLRGFYRRRALRLLPALVTFLVVVTVYRQAVHGTGRETLRGLLSVLTYVSAGQLNRPFPSGISHVWTLVVEWEFYLVWPAILVFALRRRLPRHRIGQAALAAAIALSVTRALVFHASGDNVNISYYLAWLRFDELLIGCAVGLLASRPQAPPLARSAALVGVVVIVTRAQPASHWLYLGGMLGLALLVAVVVQHRDREAGVDRLLASRPMVWIGKLSYSLYLWSVPTISEIGHHTGSWPGVAEVIADVAASFALAAASYYLVERRFRLPSRRALTTALPSEPSV